MLKGPENIRTQPPTSGILMSRRRFLNVLEFTTLTAATNFLSGCSLVEPDNCFRRLRFYGGQLGDLVKNKRGKLLIEDPQLAQRIDFQAKEFRGQPELSDANSRDQLSFAVRGVVLVSRNQLGNEQRLTREERAELLYLMAYTNQIINAAQLSREDRHSLTTDQAKAVLILALKKASEVYKAPDGKNCFDIM